MTKPRWSLALLLAVPLLLTGCVGAVDNFSGIPEHVSGEPGGSQDDGLQAFWVKEGAQLAITVFGSSSCPQIVSGITVTETATEGNSIRADFAPIPADKPCTRDFVPHTTVFSTPGTITTTEDLTIESSAGTIVLPVK